MRKPFPYKYNFIRLAAIVRKIESLNRRRYTRDWPKVRDLYYQAYLTIYSYLYGRIANNREVPEHLIEDIRHDIFHYLVGSGHRRSFFYNVYQIVCQRVDDLTKYKQIERVLGRYIYTFNKHYQQNEASYKFIEEEHIDDVYLRDITFQPDPEKIAIMRYERECIVNMLLEPPDDCRLRKDKYIRYLKLYLVHLLGKFNSWRLELQRDGGFNCQYVLYCLRKKFEDANIDMDDIYDLERYPACVSPTISEILAERLGVAVPKDINPTRKDIFVHGYQGVERAKEIAVRKYKDYERNHPRFLVPY
jgi:inorganic pyrophosphatase